MSALLTPEEIVTIQNAVASRVNNLAPDGVRYHQWCEIYRKLNAMREQYHRHALAEHFSATHYAEAKQ